MFGRGSRPSRRIKSLEPNQLLDVRSAATSILPFPLQFKTLPLSLYLDASFLLKRSNSLKELDKIFVVYFFERSFVPLINIYNSFLHSQN